MAGESFLGQDYLNAAVDFGTSLGGGVLSTLSNTASTAADAASQGVGYLASLTGGEQYGQKDKDELSSDVRPTKTNTKTTSPASVSSSSLLNFDNLTNDKFSSFKTPDISKTITDTGNNIGNLIKPSVDNLPSFGAQTSFGVASNIGLMSPTIQNPTSGISGMEGAINESIDNSNNNTQIINPFLQTIIDPSKIITPFASEDFESSAILSNPLVGGVNSMVFDSAGNVVSYAGAGAQKLYGDLDTIIKDKEKEIEQGSGNIIEGLEQASDNGIKIGKSVLWDMPYTLGGNTGNVLVNSGIIKKEQLEDVVDNAGNLSVAKIKMPDGTTLIRWKPQENPSNMKSYPKEKEESLFDKGDSYITEGIPDKLKYKSYKIDKSAAVSDNGNITDRYIPGVSNMLIKGLKHVEAPKDGEVEANIVSTVTTNGKYDPGKAIINNNKLNDIASSYTYLKQQQLSKQQIANNNTSEKEKKKFAQGNVLRKKSVTVPKVILVNALRNQLMGITSHINHKPMNYQSIMKRKTIRHNIIKEKPKELPFIQRKPDVKFKITTGLGKISGISNNIESFISIGSSNKLVKTPSFNFDLDNMLYNLPEDMKIKKKPKK